MKQVVGKYYQLSFYVYYNYVGYYVKRHKDWYDVCTYCTHLISQLFLTERYQVVQAMYHSIFWLEMVRYQVVCYKSNCIFTTLFFVSIVEAQKQVKVCRSGSTLRIAHYAWLVCQQGGNNEIVT
eukprot:TRINITY_DN1283_c0_g2_i3.p4 TRINITY_DN1283_c0_g2~~TRINITY_DN1283_c0_g2_i3.p4  ORF type:complete len:124 (-),score=2.09 TRINITY_DN1283_c0_g2_i3:402-773(-)